MTQIFTNYNTDIYELNGKTYIFLCGDLCHLRYLRSEIQ